MSGGDEVRYRSYINHAIYARERGFVHHVGIGLGPAIYSPYYYKYNAIEEMLRHFDWLLYLDDDVYVTDFNTPYVEEHLRAAERDDIFLVVAEGPLEPDGTWTKLNTGVMLLRNDARAFRLLDEARRADLGAIGRSWSPTEEGLFTNGDQDAIWRSVRDDDELRSGTRIVPHTTLNSRAHLYGADLHDAFAVHFCGPGDKLLKAADFGRRFGMDDELIPAPFYEKYSVRRHERMSDLSLARRRASQRRALLARRLRRKVDFISRTGRWR